MLLLLRLYLLGNYLLVNQKCFCAEFKRFVTIQAAIVDLPSWISKTEANFFDEFLQHCVVRRLVAAEIFLQNRVG